MYCCQIMQFLKFQKKSMKNWISNTLLRSGKKLMDNRCLTNQKQFYMENYPDVVIENGKIDDLVVMMEEQV